MSEDARKLVYAVIQYLKRQLMTGDLSSDAAEGVEVGIQCLQAAYNLNELEENLYLPFRIEDAFQKYVDLFEADRHMHAVNEIDPALLFCRVPGPKETKPTSSRQASAEEMKHSGNICMSCQNYSEAVAYYTKAIQLDPKNAVYYCNRAAALNKLGHYENCIQDCKNALKIDPKYCKAYGRLGLAQANLNQYKEAIVSYKKALELDPANETYKANLKLAQDALASSTSNNPPVSVQNSDLAMIFANPNLLTMASQMLANPSMQEMMSSILSGNMPPQEGGVGGRFDVLLQASQQLAQQMENENPALIEQLRRRMNNGGASNEGGSSSGSKPKPPNPDPEA